MKHYFWKKSVKISIVTFIAKFCNNWLKLGFFFNNLFMWHYYNIFGYYPRHTGFRIRGSSLVNSRSVAVQNKLCLIILFDTLHTFKHFFPNIKLKCVEWIRNAGVFPKSNMTIAAATCWSSILFAREPDSTAEKVLIVLDYY